MGRDYISIAGAPIAEPCVQLMAGQDSTAANRAECKIFIEQLMRQFPNLRCGLIVKGNQHDFGDYYQVAATYQEDDEGQEEDAFMLESSSPENWDEIAKTEVEALKAKYPGVTWGG